MKYDFLKHFGLFSIDHWYWVGFELFVVCAIALVCAWIWLPKIAARKNLWWIPLVLLAVSFPLFRPDFPSYHGDGEMGISPIESLTWNSADSFFDNMEQIKSQRFLTMLVTKLGACPLHFDTHFSNTENRNTDNVNPRDDWMILFCWVFGWMFLGALAIIIPKLTPYKAERFGYALFLGTTPCLLNAYGHYDSYMLQVLAFVPWAVLVYKGVAKHRLSCMIGAFFYGWFALWVHMLFFILPGITVVLWVFFFKTPLSNFPWSRFRIILCGILMAGAIFFCSGKNITYSLNLKAPIWLILTKFHASSMFIVYACLPSFLLLYWNRFCWRYSFAVYLLLAASLPLFFFIETSWFILDEFVYSLLSLPVLLAVVFALVDPRRKDQGQRIIQAGLISAFIYIPAMITYSGDLIVDRGANDIIYDTASATMGYSPTVLLGNRACIDTEKLQRQKVAFFRQGFEHSLPIHSDAKLSNLMYYTAWCYEFGYIDQAIPATEALARYNPNLAARLLLPFTMFTGRAHNRAYLNARETFKHVFGARLKKNPDDQVALALLRFIIKLENHPVKIGPQR